MDFRLCVCWFWFSLFSFFFSFLQACVLCLCGCTSLLLNSSMIVDMLNGLLVVLSGSLPGRLGLQNTPTASLQRGKPRIYIMVTFLIGLFFFNSVIDFRFYICWFSLSLFSFFFFLEECVLFVCLFVCMGVPLFNIWSSSSLGHCVNVFLCGGINLWKLTCHIIQLIITFFFSVSIYIYIYVCTKCYVIRWRFKMWRTLEIMGRRNYTHY